MLLIILLSVLGLITYLSVGLVISRRQSEEIYLTAKAVSGHYYSAGFRNQEYHTKVITETWRWIFFWLPITVFRGSSNVFNGVNQRLYGYVLKPIDNKREEIKQLIELIEFWSGKEYHEDEAAICTVSLAKDRLKELEKYKP